jgi:MFS family permease
MPIDRSSLVVFFSVLASTTLFPVARPFVYASGASSGAWVHAFFAAALLGGLGGTSLLSRWRGRSLPLSTVLRYAAAVDAVALGALLLGPSLPWMLCWRLVGGAGALVVLSIAMGAAAERSSRSLGVAAAATLTAIALGPALGAALLRIGVNAAIAAAVACAALSALLAFPLVDDSALPSRSTTDAASGVDVRWPRGLLAAAALVLGERLSIGVFVGTFALHAKHTLHLADGRSGGLLSAFLLPFVLSAAVSTRLSAGAAAAKTISASTAVYGISLLSLPVAPDVARTAGLLAVAGTAAGGIYGPALIVARAAVEPGWRANAMARVNHAGALGMLAGASLAAAVTVCCEVAGLGPRATHGVLFAIAGAAPLAAWACARTLVRSVSVPRALDLRADVEVPS